MAAVPPDPSFGEVPGFLATLEGVRIYAQLKPDADGLGELVRLQAAARALAPRARPVSPGRLHLTLIHFGKAGEAYTRLADATGVSRAEFGRALRVYLAATEAALPDHDFLLPAVGLAGFGVNGTTLAVECRPTQELDEVHAALYGLLLEFLVACGVPDPASLCGRRPGAGVLGSAAAAHQHPARFPTARGSCAAPCDSGTDAPDTAAGAVPDLTAGVRHRSCTGRGRAGCSPHRSSLPPGGARERRRLKA